MSAHEHTLESYERILQRMNESRRLAVVSRYAKLHVIIFDDVAHSKAVGAPVYMHPCM